MSGCGVMTVNWGDLPTWVGAVTTLGALIAARRLIKVELERDERAAEDRRRAEEDRARSEQAALVATWPGPSPGSSGRGIVVRNGSNLPIYGVEVTLHSHSGRPDILVVVEDVIPPGDRWYPFPESVFEVNELGDRVGDTRDDWAPAIEFEDAAGRLWGRNEDGVLERLDV